MSRKKRTEYLSYIEETPKHHNRIVSVAKKATRKAIRVAHSNNLYITYSNGKEIVREYPDGKKIILETLTHTPKKVKVGSKTKI